MECSICMNAITAATGSTTTSCGHTYHLGCFVRWIMNPEHETCPLCRAVPAEEEKVAVHDDNESEAESEDEENDWGSDRTTNLEIPEFDAENHAFWVMRRTFALAEADEHGSVSSAPEKKTQTSDSYKDHWSADCIRMRTGHYLCPNIDEERGYESA